MKTNTSSFDNFSNKYSVSKTLRFELKPQGKTKTTFEQWANELRNIDSASEKNLLLQDEIRAENYVKVKKIIDEFHKFFIERCLVNFQFDHDLLSQYKLQYFNASKTPKDQKTFEKLQLQLRTALSKAFSSGIQLKIEEDTKVKITAASLKKKELITIVLPWFIGENWSPEIEARLKEHEVSDKNQALSLVSEFDKFTTYFKGFHENRANMYVKDDKSTAIAYRIVHENLPKFLENEKAFSSLQTSHPNFKLEELQSQLEPALDGAGIEEFFSLPYFNYCITQSGIDQYNTILGGWSEEGSTKVQGLNEAINLYRQKHKLKRGQLGNFTPLYKQVLSDRESVSFLPEAFENDDAVFESIQQFIKRELLTSTTDSSQSITEALAELFQQLPYCNLSNVYFRNDNSITRMSQALFSDWSVLPKALEEMYVNEHLQNSKLDSLKKAEKAHEALKKFDVLTVASLDDALSSIDSEKSTASYFQHFTTAKEPESNLAQKLNQAILSFDKAFEKHKKGSNTLRQKKNNPAVESIKHLLDICVEILRFIKPLHHSSLDKNKDETFYNDFDQLYDQLDLITPLYNKVRNYITQKPYSKEKFPLNFEKNTLLDGWDKNKETANLGVLLLKEENYFLGIMKTSSNKSFVDVPTIKSTSHAYQKMNYKLLPGPDKMLPKVFFSKKNIDYYNPSEEILAIRNHSEHTKNGTPQAGFAKKEFSKKAAHKMIDFFKASIAKHEDWKHFGFNFSDTSTYADTSEFYSEISEQGYKLTFENIPDTYIDELVNKGELFLFQIYNKDFSPYSKGTPNLHTLYWKAVFSPENLKNTVYKLNGEAEIFYRKRSIDPKTAITHKANEPIENKDPNTTNKHSTFAYDIVKDKRFTVDKIHFHVPVTMNFKAEGKEYLNEDVQQYLRNNPNAHVIGIDRGERHLLYLTLTDNKGRLIKQLSLNEILSDYSTANGERKTVTKNYHQLLEKREKERDEARKAWGTIENIKELKEGYLSQVVHKISKMVIEYNAIVVLEDLNMGFKRGRQKVEKQVYQKFEKMLIDKLNYLVFKNEDWQNPGGVLHAFQLTSKFTSFKKMGKQNGILFFVPPSFTSKIDPITGFVNFFYNRYESVAKSQLFFKRFENICYNKQKDWFEFTFDYNDFHEKAKQSKSKWTVCTNGERISTYRNAAKNHQYDSEKITLTPAFKTLLNNAKIDIEHNLQQQIVQQEDKAFFKELMHLFRLTVQMRNSVTGTDEDFMISPVAPFYDSRDAAKKGKDNSGAWKAPLPVDADANGAYHIALKGVMLIDRMSHVKTGQKVDLKISKEQWLQFAQKE